MRRLALPLAVVMALAIAPAAPAAQKVITSSGPLTNVYLNDDLGCAVERNGALQTYSGTNPGSCGTFLELGGNTYGPSGIPAGNPVNVAFTAVSQVGVTGAGTAASPFQVTTVTDAGATGVRLTQTDRYVTGDDFYTSQVSVANSSGSPQNVKLYHASDCFLGGDSGYGHTTAGAAGNTNVYCSGAPNTAASGVFGFEPLTAGSRFLEDGFGTVYGAVGSGADLPNTCDCTVLQDNGAGISWSFTVPSGGAPVTQQFRTRTGNSTAPPPPPPPPASTADLGVSLKASPAPVEPGNDLTLTGTVVNRGPATAPDATLTFSHPSTVAVRSTSDGCQQKTPTSTQCALGTMEVGQSSSRQMVVVPKDEGTVATGASASSSRTDPAPGDNTASSTATVKLPPPVQRQSFNTEVQRGAVNVKCPGDDKFRGISGDNDLRFGCEIDTRHGRLELTTAAGGGKTQSALFYEGVFKVAQTGGPKPVTELTLTGPLQTGTWARGSKAVQQARRRRRRLWGRGRGRFRTRGRRGSASVRGTTWLVEDRSNDTTFFKVASGRVAVRDFARHKTVTIGGKKKKTYTAKPRRRRR